jgi:hypothetical protein
MRRIVTGVAAVAAAFGGASAVIAKSEHGPTPERTVPGLQLQTALDRGHSGDRHGRSRSGPRFEVSLSKSASKESLDGRVYVIVSRDGESEPREQVDVPDGTPFWGRNVDALEPGGSVELSGGDRDVFGYPLRSIGDLPEGEYHVQAFMNVYTTFHRSDGSVVKLHMPCGDGHDVFGGTGNLHSAVETVRVRPGDRRPVRLSLTEVIPPSDPVPPGGTCQQGNPPDTDHVKHVKIKSERLSRFWGRPMYIAANVLLPKGYEEHPDARYPVVYQHGHYPGPNPFSFREDGGNAFSQWWLSDEPRDRVIAVTFRHENPYYDDSYAVNSANLGPYGDAITKELMVELDRRFRTTSESWARSLTGGSTGGWESLAQQVFYPELYAGTFSTCPDPVDFRYHQIVNMYSDDNAYYRELEWNRVPRPGARSVDGNVSYTMEDENHFELAIGDRGRSGGQWDIWEAVYGPQGRDGYPARAWDKLTGEIDHEVSERWRPMDLRDHLERNWTTLAPKLVGKHHIWTGDDDTYYLENAVKLLEQSFAKLQPSPQATIEYGRERPHCYTPFANSQALIAAMATFMREHAPAGADTTSWRY